MLESSLEYLQCVRCGNGLELEIFEYKNEIIEGVLTCKICNNAYPIISSIPILLDDLSSYFSIRTKLGGYLMLHAKNKKVKSIIKKSLKEIRQVKDDTTDLEINWAKIYKNSKDSKLDDQIKSLVKKLSRCDFALEHGCSIGKTTEILAKHTGMIFGIDKSFFALVEAKKCKIKNSDFFVADSLSKPFGCKKFDLVIALNVLELIDPLDLLKTIDDQASRFVILSDPYDYERGKNSVKNRLDEKTLRKKLTQMGFKLILGTSRPNFIPWSLNVNSRLELNYKVDLIFAKR